MTWTSSGIFSCARQPTRSRTISVSTSLSGLLVEVLSFNSGDNIETQVTLVKSYPVLEEVARRLNKLPQTASTEAVRESRAYLTTLDAIGAKIRAARVPSTSIIEITATSTNAREARDLANTVAEVYREYNKQTRNARITEARKFIEGQLRDVEARVKKAEEEVWAFRDANRIIAPGAESTVLLSLFTQVRDGLCGDHIDWLRSVDHAEPLRLCLGPGQKSTAHAFKEVVLFALDAIRGGFDRCRVRHIGRNGQGANTG